MRIAGGSLVVLLVVSGSCGDADPAPIQDTSGASEADSTANATAASTAADTAATSSTPPASTSVADTTAAAGDTAAGSTAAPADSSSGAGSSSGGSTDTGKMPVGEPNGIHFVAFGDTGEGNEAQQLVANAAEQVCDERGCELALLLGDNFYDTGVTSVTDTQFTDKFETVYEGFDIPFYIVLGNHDYGTLANDWARGEFQIQYTSYSDKWVMPDFWYTFSSDSGGTQFFAFDTARMMWGHDVDVQRNWLEGEMQASTADWKIAFAHHPYLSNGQHGNAGTYEGIPGIPFLSGVEIQEYIDDFICGQAQIYISGHDHNRQVFDPVCGTYFFVSGASAKTSGFEYHQDNPTQWDDDTREGFLWVGIEGTELTSAFYDLDGNLDHEMSFEL